MPGGHARTCGSNRSSRRGSHQLARPIRNIGLVQGVLVGGDGAGADVQHHLAAGGGRRRVGCPEQVGAPVGLAAGQGDLVAEGGADDVAAAEREDQEHQPGAMTHIG